MNSEQNLLLSIIVVVVFFQRVIFIYSTTIYTDCDFFFPIKIREFIPPLTLYTLGNS